MGRRLNQTLLRLRDAVVLAGLKAVTRFFRALPSPWVLFLADRLGDLAVLVDARGRRVARQNMRVMLGDGVDAETKRWIRRRSMRGGMRAVLVMLHASPLTPDRVRRWVEIPPEVEQRLRGAMTGRKGAVVVSGHVGSWELLLGLASVFRDLGETTFLVEASVAPAVDEFLVWLRGSSGARSRNRRGGAVALTNHVKRGGVAALLVDRNTRRDQGGLWVPFFGLEACTTQLPGYLARRHDVPIAPLFLLPIEHGRYRLEAWPEIALDVRTDDPEADVLEITRRINRILEDVIRQHPEAWNWTLKRFKSRPTQERGDYPAYSLWDKKKRHPRRRRRR